MIGRIKSHLKGYELDLQRQSKVFPKIIHQTWKTKDLPINFEIGQTSWLENHPSWEYKFWTDQDNLDFIKDHYPCYLQFYKDMPLAISKVDFVRYLYMHNYGGVYADMDFICLKDLTPLLHTDYDIILGCMGEDRSFEHSIPNALLISKPKENFWIYLISSIIERYSDTESLKINRPEYLTGPVALRDAYLNYANYSKTGFYNSKSKIEVLSENYFYPINWNSNKGKMEMKNFNSEISLPALLSKYPNSFALTYWAHTWE